MTKVTRLEFNRKCANIKCELKTYHEFLQVFLNGKQIASFHIPRVRRLIGEEDAKGSGDPAIVKDNQKR